MSEDEQNEKADFNCDAGGLGAGLDRYIRNNDIAALHCRVLRHAPMGMFVKDADNDFRYVDVNEFLLKSVGRLRADIIGRLDSDIWGDELAREYRKHDEAAVSGNCQISVRERYLSVNGQTHEVRTLRSLVCQNDGHRFVVGYWVDISSEVGRERRMEEERDAARKAERSEAFIARLLKGVVSLPLGTDPMDYLLAQIGKDLQVDRCYIYTCKFDGVMWLTDHVYEWCDVGIASERENLVRKGPPGLPDFCETIDAGEDFVFANTADFHPVTRAWFEHRGVKSFFSTPIKDENGVSVGYLGFDYVRCTHEIFSPAGRAYAHETANVVNICYMRQRAIDDACRAERAKSDFFASVSHDIRTPLNSIIGFSELLRTETDPVHRAEYLDNVTFSGNALLELINDVLDLSMMDAGKLKLNRTFFDMRGLLVRVLRTQVLAAREKGIAFESCFENELPMICLDEHRVRQVLFNIIGNAVKYTDKGKVTVRVTFARETADRGTVSLVVADTGIGIAAEDIPRLMRPYERIQAADPRGGTGLGLAICRHVVENAGGRITIESKLGVGSVFTIIVPDVAYRESNGSPDISLEVETNGVSDLSELRVLVVDDLEMNRKVLAATCRELGVRDVTAVNSGRAALAALDGGCMVDVALVDMKMPGMSGGELIQELHQNPKYSRLPAYLVTADVAALKYASEIGASGVLLKPIVRARLKETLAAVSFEKRFQ